MFNGFLTIDMLKVFAVAVSVAVILTVFLKEAVDWMYKKFEITIHTKYIVLLFALFVVYLPITVPLPSKSLLQVF